MIAASGVAGLSAACYFALRSKGGTRKKKVKKFKYTTRNTRRNV